MATCSSAHFLFPPEGARQTIACVMLYSGDAILQVGISPNDGEIFNETQSEQSMAALGFLALIPNE